MVSLQIHQSCYFFDKCFSISPTWYHEYIFSPIYYLFIHLLNVSFENTSRYLLPPSTWVLSFETSFADECCRTLSACFLLHLFKCCINPLFLRNFLLHSTHLNSFLFPVISSVLSLCAFSIPSLNLITVNVDGINLLAVQNAPINWLSRTNTTKSRKHRDAQKTSKEKSKNRMVQMVSHYIGSVRHEQVNRLIRLVRIVLWLAREQTFSKRETVLEVQNTWILTGSFFNSKVSVFKNIIKAGQYFICIVCNRRLF